MKKTIISLLTTAAVATTTLAAEDKLREYPLATAHTYVLVHGAWQAPYVWDAVKTNLENKGNKVMVIQLPGHGADNTPAHTLSIAVYRDKVIEAVAVIKEKVILVGHSMGGMVISAVAEKVPHKITKLVYIGAFLPANGQSLTDLAYADPDSKLGPLLVPSADKLTLDVQPDSLTYLFIDDGDQNTKKALIDNYRAEPAIPFTNKVTLTNENFRGVPKAYIKTLQDVVISAGMQDRMIAAAGIKQIYSVNTGHSPFLSQPKEVSDLLMGIANQVHDAARLIRYDVKPECMTAFRKAIGDYVLHSLEMEDNILSEAYYEETYPSVMWLIERWRSKNAIEKAGHSMQFKAIDSLSATGVLRPAQTIYVKDLEPLSKEQWRRSADKSDKPITIMLFVDSRAGTENDFKQLYHSAMPAFRNESGVINYQLSQLEEDSSRFVTYEKFRNEKDFQYHLNFPPIQPVITYLNTNIQKQPFQAGLHRLIAFASVTSK